MEASSTTSIAPARSTAREVRRFPQGAGASRPPPQSALLHLQNHHPQQLFGVDIMEEAVEICKLRLFLKLAAQVEPDATHNLGSSRCRTSTSTSAPATRSSATPPRRGASGVSGAAKLDFDNAMEKSGQRPPTCSRHSTHFAHVRSRATVLYRREDKQELRRRLRRWKTSSTAISPASTASSRAKKEAYGKWLKSHQPFHWFVEFYGICQRRWLRRHHRESAVCRVCEGKA